MLKHIENTLDFGSWFYNIEQYYEELYISTIKYEGFSVEIVKPPSAPPVKNKIISWKMFDLFYIFFF